MNLPFTKMQGLGNDFIVLDGFSSPISLTTQQIRHLADRHFGIGCDQLLLVERPMRNDADFRYRIFNADGSEVEQCGNGARCFALFVRDKKLTDKREIRVETMKGIITPVIQDNGDVRVELDIPTFIPAKIPIAATEAALHYQLNIDGQEISFASVAIGNPHAVIQVENIDTAPVLTLGAKLEPHSFFPNRVNVGFMQIMNKDQLRLRVYERGVGETLACGSGACAAVVVGIAQKLLHNSVRVELTGGQLEVSWGGEGQPVYLTGSAATVFEGTIKLWAPL